MSLRDSMMARFAQLQQEQQARDAAALEAARTQPIPGLTGPTSQGQIPGQIPGQVGMAPPQQPMPQQPLQPPQMGNHMFNPVGPYGQQAVQLAGLLGGGQGMQPGMRQPVGGIRNNMLLGSKSQMPFYRPVGK
jgi:hypothetical protein